MGNYYDSEKVAKATAEVIEILRKNDLTIGDVLQVTTNIRDMAFAPNAEKENQHAGNMPVCEDAATEAFVKACETVKSQCSS